MSVVLLLLLVLFPLQCASALELNESCPVPDIAPPVKDVHEVFQGLGGTRRVASEFIIYDFIGATYVAKCDGVTRPLILPVYYDVGQRVDLPCAVCHKHMVYNGKIKHWKVLKVKHPDYGTVDNFMNLMDKWNKKDGGLLEMDDLYSVLRKGDRGRYFQRDGRLIIVGTNETDAGLYWCMDETIDKTDPEVKPQQFFYLLIPKAPIVLHPNDNGRVQYELEAVKKGISALYYDDSTFACKGTKAGCIDYIPSTSTYPNMESPMPMKQKEVVAVFDNYIKWSPWSSCSRPEQRVRTRQGNCLMKFKGKINVKWDTDTTVNEYTKRFSHIVVLAQQYGLRMFNGIFDMIDTEGRRSPSKRLFVDTFSFNVKASTENAPYHRCYHVTVDPAGYDIHNNDQFAKMGNLTGRGLFQNERCAEKTDKDYNYDLL